MLSLRWLPSALADLDSIVNYIAARDEAAAYRLWTAIERAVEKIPERPELYRQGSVKGTRELVVHPNYFVVYQFAADVIEIVAIVHSHRHYPA